jgi:formyltetrahydrofolate deformylase
MSSLRATFLVDAPDQPGLVARLAGFFYNAGLNIVDAGNHTDPLTDGGPRFFMRIVVDVEDLTSPAAVAAFGVSAARNSLNASFGKLCATLSATWSVRYNDDVSRLAILVTTDPACLYDLILRQRAREFTCEIPLLISNHPTLESVAESFHIPFHYLPVTAATRSEQEKGILDLLESHRIDLVVLARYMQILSEGFIADAPPVINIHHGFLPAFQGARPYHQAHARGVKLVGATAHYATRDLDQGPIIEQDVARVSHAMGPDEMVRVGRDVERVVLSRAVRAHLERRVIVQGRRTVVL